MVSWWRHYSKTLKGALRALHGFRLRKTKRCHFKRTRTQMILKMNTANWIIYLPMDMCYLWLIKSIFSQFLTPFIGHYNIILLMIWHENCEYKVHTKLEQLTSNNEIGKYVFTYYPWKYFQMTEKMSLLWRHHDVRPLNLWSLNLCCLTDSNEVSHDYVWWSFWFCHILPSWRHYYVIISKPSRVPSGHSTVSDKGGPIVLISIIKKHI